VKDQLLGLDVHTYIPGYERTVLVGAFNMAAVFKGELEAQVGVQVHLLQNIPSF
jgi:hypothetical protein